MSYLRQKRCDKCGRGPHWFKEWIGKYCQSSRNGLNVTDFDECFHRFRRVLDRKGFRDVEHIMVVEVKTSDETLRPNQRDTLSVYNAIFNTLLPVNGDPIEVESRPGFIIPGEKKIVWHGVHLLRVPFEEDHFGGFVWDNRPISFDNLVAVLNFDNCAANPQKKLDIDRRHKAGDDHPKLWRDHA